LITLLLTTLLLMARIMQARARLTGVTTRDQLVMVVAQTGLKRLGPELSIPLRPSGMPLDERSDISIEIGWCAFTFLRGSLDCWRSPRWVG
jgi:hypothetical protein